MNELPSRSSQEQSSSRSRSMSNQSNLNNIKNRDELEVCNDQTYEEILQRFNSQKQRMHDCPEKGDVIKCTNSCIALQEEYCEVIPCDENNQQEPSSPRDKERVISTKICDDGCNYIKETVIERTHFTQEGLVVKTKHIIEKCGKEDDRRNSIANKISHAADNGTDSSNVVATRKRRSSSSEQKQYERENNQRTRSRHSQSSRDRSSDGTINGKKTRTTPRKNRYKSTGEKSDVEMPDSSETNQQHSSTNSTPQRSCQEDICCQFFSVPENSCCCLTSQNNNDDCCRAPKICACVCQDCMTSPEETTIRADGAENHARDDMERPKRIYSSSFESKVEEFADKTPLDRDTTQSLKSNSGLNRRGSNGDRSLVSSSTNASDDEKIENISIQLFSSSVSSRSNNRSRNQCCSCECEDTCCITAPTFQNCSASQAEASKLLAEIIIPSEYNCGVSLPSVNGSVKENVSSRRSRKNSQGNARKESRDDISLRERTQKSGVQHKSVSTATRKERPLSQRNENIQNISETNRTKTPTDMQEFTVDDNSRRRNSNQHERFNHERIRNDICDDEDNDTLRRKTSKHHQRYSIRNEDVDSVSFPNSDDFSELDDETTPARMKTNANSTMKKSGLNEYSDYPKEENAKQNCRSRPIKRTIMIPLVYVAPAQGCSNTCRCSGNQPHFIQISGFQSTASSSRSPLSLKYRIISDEEEGEECNDSSKGKSENERLTRRKSSGEEKPFSSSDFKPFTLSCLRPRYSNDTFVLYTSKRKRLKSLQKIQTSSQREKERESPIPSSDSSENDSSSQTSLEDRDQSKSSSGVESSRTSFLEAGEQCERTSTQCARKCCCRNQSDTNDRSSSKESSCSDDEAAASISKDRCPPKFNLLAEITLKDVNAPRTRSQDNCCAEICCKCKCNSQSDSNANDGLKMHSDRAFPYESCQSENVSRRRRKRKSSVCDSEDFSRCSCSGQSFTDIEKMFRNPCANENSSQSEQFNRPCRCSYIEKDKQCKEEETEAKEPPDPANVIIRSETNEKVDYYRENRRDDNNELSVREERYRKSSVNITNVSQAPVNFERATTDAEVDESDESSDDISSESNDSDDSSTECENQDECCNQITEKCTQTESCCCMCESGVPKSPCNDYCFSEINPTFGSTPGCDYQCFDPPKSNADPMECFFFTPNNEQFVCPCNASGGKSSPNETGNKNYEDCSNNGATQQNTKDIGSNPCCNETNDKSTISQNCCCEEKAQCEKSFNEKCTQTEECSLQFFMDQQENCNGFCYQQSCIHTSPPMASQCVYQCFGHTECSLPPNPQPVFPTCNMPYPPQYQYPTSQPMPNCQAPCSFPFPDTQPCCHPQYQQHTTTNSMTYCDAFDDQTLPSTSCKK